MSLERSAEKQYLTAEYERYRGQAERARANEDRQTAARLYRHCVALLEDVAELEPSDRLTAERRELAANLDTVAERLEGGEPPTAPTDDGGSSTGHSGGSPSESDAETEADPERFLADAPERDFGDVGGMSALKETLKDQVIDPLERSALYEQYDLGVVNGVLLYGPPGTGKTYIAGALAGELGYQYVQARAADISSSLVGEAAGNMQALFEVARANQPALVFLDELDALAAQRSGGSQKTMSESQMITQFLTEMSAIDGEDVVVVAATNLPEEIDGAAWRRFDERVEVPPPDAIARAAILRVHCRDRPVVTEDIEWATLSEQTAGYAASDLELIAATAARRALKEARDADSLVPIAQQHLEAAIKDTDSSLEAWNR